MTWLWFIHVFMNKKGECLMILGFTIIGFGIGYIVVAILNESRKNK